MRNRHATITFPATRPGGSWPYVIPVLVALLLLLGTTTLLVAG